jgi:dienelactone hydrolase
MKKIMKKIIVTLACIVVLMVFGLYIYSLDYYKAEPIAIEAISINQLNIENLGDMVVFKPKVDNSKTGFIFYPGGKVENLAYAPLMEKIAEKGYTCVLLKAPFNLAIFDINGADRAMERVEHVTKWYVGGHSLGGAMSSEYAEKNSDKLEGIIFLGSYPSGDLSGTNLKMLSIYGSKDKVLNKEALEKSKVNEPAQTTFKIIEGGNHAYFGTYGEQDGDGKALITNAEQHSITADIISDFIESIPN